MSVSNATADGQGLEQPGTGAGQAPGTADAGQGQQDGFWGLFPNVPEEMRGELEPHLKGIQSYITKREMEFAPFKPLIEGGYQPQDIQAVMQFGEQLQQDPVGTVIGLLERLQETGAVHAEMDLDAVRAAAEGRFEEETGGLPGDITEPAVSGQEGGIPDWAMALQQQNQQILQRFQQQDAQTQQRTQDALLKNRVGQFSQELEKAGINVSETFEDPKAAEKWLVANLMTHGMDVGAAVQGVIGFKEAAMKGLVDETDESHGTNDLELPRGVPSKPRAPGGRQDAYAKANAAALNDLQRNIRANAQGT